MGAQQVHSDDLAGTMSAVAKALLGEPNKSLSRGGEWRYGSQGSLSVDTDKGTWFSHEEAQGGGVLDLIRRERGGAVSDALRWMETVGIRSAVGLSSAPASPHTRSAVRLRSGQRIVATYEYRKEGALLFRKHRVEPGSGDRAKDFVQERPDGRGGWIANLQGVERIPYRYDDLVAAPADDMVFLVEGEKQADLLASWGFVASSLKDWRSEWSTLVGSRRVIILPDNDEAGFKQGTQAAAMLPESVILNLPDLPEAGDIMDWRGGPEDLLDLAKAAIAEGAKASGPPTFPIADLNTWSNIAATPKSFLMPGYVPARELTLATGAGGANKSTFGQQLATCVAGGVPMLGIDVQQGSALYITAEDDEDRLHWMQEHLCKAVGVRLSALVGQLHLASLRGRLGNELATFDGDGKLRPSPSFVTLKATIVSTQAKLVVLDNAAHLFVGNENDRGQVTAFVNLLYSLCVELGVTIILVAHANKAGDSYSGSTAWLNAVRSQIVLTRPEGAVDPDERVLTLGKANYARQGEELRFRWHDFALRLENELPDDVREEHAKNVTASADNTIFLNCLRKRIEQRRAVSEKRGPNFAATEFAKMAESKSIGKSRLEQAMERLFTIGAIERAYLWRSDDRKDVFGLRETAANGAPTVRANGAANGAQTLCANATNGVAIPQKSVRQTLQTHTPPLRGVTGAPQEAVAPLPSASKPKRIDWSAFEAVGDNDGSNDGEHTDR